MSTRDDAHHDLRHHNITEQFHAMHDSVADAQHRVDTLEIWKRWATGQTISTHDVHDAIDALTDHRTGKQTPEHALGQAIQTWATQHGIQAPAGPVPQRSLAHGGIEREL